MDWELLKLQKMHADLRSLVSSNAKAYATFKRKRRNHIESLALVLKSRYIFSKRNRKKVIIIYSELKENMPNDIDCDEETKDLIVLIQAIAINELSFKPRLGEILLYTRIAWGII